MKWIMSGLILAMTCSAFAKSDTYDLTGRWGVGLGLGLTSVTEPDLYRNGANELDSKLAAGLWVRYHLSTRLGLELGYTRLMYEFKDSTLGNLDPANELIDLSVAYRAWPEEVFHLLLQAGAGYVRYSDFAPVDGKADDFFVKGRVGFEFMATPDLMLAVHGDYYHMNNGSGTDSKLDVVAPMLALTYYFGGSPEPKVSDTDGDGVPDEADKCPGTSPGVSVGADGCELKEKKPNDADLDGVVDADDKCPNTPAGQAVNEFGCAKTEKIEITLNVRFKPGSSVVDPQYVSDLEKFAEFLAKYPETKAEIEGHTDNTGGEKLNYKISQQRADSVRNYLTGKLKVDKARLTSKGYGPSQPVDDNTKPEGRAKNRRVVAHVQTEK